MILQTSFTIDGKIVTLIKEGFMGMDVYWDGDDDGISPTLYFVNKFKQVAGKMEIDVDRTAGYVDGIIFCDTLE